MASNINRCSRLPGNPVVYGLTHMLQMYHLLCLHIYMCLGIFKNNSPEVECFDIGGPVAS